MPSIDTDPVESSPLVHLPSISEEPGTLYDDHMSPVEFDLLEDPNSLGVMNISGQFCHYFSFWLYKTYVSFPTYIFII
jgi:hypothetical protein